MLYGLKQTDGNIMTKQDVKWASTHDWFMSSFYDDVDGYCVYVRLDVADVEPLDCFTCLESLKEWAGY